MVLKAFILAIATTVFIALVIGTTVEVNEAPAPDPDPPSGVLEIVQSILSRIWATILFIGNAITFNVPGAPWYIRAIIGTLIAAPIVWGIVKLIRGT